MAKGVDTVEVPAQLMADLKAQVESLRAEVQLAREREQGVHEKQVYDAAWEKRVAEAALSAAERTQRASDKEYGTAGPRWKVWLDSTDRDGRPGPSVAEWPAVLISANSPEEAEARWLRLCGVRSHKHTLRAEAVAA